VKVSFLAREREFFVPYRATSYRTMKLREYRDRTVTVIGTETHIHKYKKLVKTKLN
jgi:hypothetical protein